jgi:hypothetical protein
MVPSGTVIGDVLVGGAVLAPPWLVQPLNTTKTAAVARSFNRITPSPRSCRFGPAM